MSLRRFSEIGILLTDPGEETAEAASRSRLRHGPVEEFVAAALIAEMFFISFIGKLGLRQRRIDTAPRFLSEPSTRPHAQPLLASAAHLQRAESFFIFEEINNTRCRRNRARSSPRSQRKP